MTHVITRPRPEVLTVDFNGKRYEVTLTENGAHAPSNLAEYMIQRGLVARGHEPDPGPQWEKHSKGWGDRIDPFARFVKEIPKSDIDENATPAAVAAILAKRK